MNQSLLTFNRFEGNKITPELTGANKFTDLYL